MLKSLPLCGPTARSSVENEKLGVTTEVMMPLKLVLAGDAGAERQRLEDVQRVLVEGSDARTR